MSMIVRDEPKLPDILEKICTSLSSPLFSLFSTLFSVTRRAQDEPFFGDLITLTLVQHFLGCSEVKVKTEKGKANVEIKAKSESYLIFSHHCSCVESTMQV